MNAMDRAGAVFSAAHHRSPLAVMPGHVLSPMDREATVTLGGDLIADCEPSRPAERSNLYRPTAAGRPATG